MASGKHCVFAAATGIIYYITRSRNCGLQKISVGDFRGGGRLPPPETCLAETLGEGQGQQPVTCFSSMLHVDLDFLSSIGPTRHSVEWNCTHASDRIAADRSLYDRLL